MAARGLILASGSPRRQELIRELGLPVELRPVDVNEAPEADEPPEETASRLALAKAEAAAARGGDGIVVAADTIVAIDGLVLGKPSSPPNARATLRRLRGRWHRVVTGVALVDLSSGRREVRPVVTRVRMRDYRDEEIEAYLRSGKALDKAGAYGIQDQEFGPVARIEGCYLNVVGLPLCAIARGLRRLGLDPPPSRYASDECHCGGRASPCFTSGRSPR